MTFNLKESNAKKLVELAYLGFYILNREELHKSLGNNKQAVQKYIQNQEKEHLISDQISMVEYYDLFEKWLKSNKEKRNIPKKK